MANRRFWLLSVSIATVLATRSQGQGVKELVGHKEAVAAAAYSPEGKTIATGSFDKTIKLWDSASLKETRTLEGHAGMVLTLTFLKQGTGLISGGDDNTVKFWDFGPGQEPRALGPNPVVGKALATSPDGKLIAQAGEDGVIRLYDVATGKVARECKGHSGPVNTVIFSADGSKIYSAGADRTVRAFEAASAQPLGSLELGSQPAIFLAIDPKGQVLFTATASGEAQRWTLPLASPRVLKGPDGEVVRLLVHPNGTHLIAIGSDKTARTIDIASGAVVATITSPSAILGASAGPAGSNLFATVGDDKSLRVWNLADGKALAAREGLKSAVTSITWTQDGKALIAGDADGALSVHPYPFQPELGVTALPAHDAPLTAIDRAGDGTLLLTASEDKTVKLWSSTGQPIRAFAMFASIKNAALSPNKQLVAAVSSTNELRLWTALGQELRVQGGVAGPVAFSGDGRFIAWGGADNKVYLLPGSGQGDAKGVATHQGPLSALMFSPTGDRLFSAGADKGVKVVDTAKGAEIATFNAPAPVLALSISPDGKTLFSAGDDKNVTLWDVGNGKSTATLSGAAAPVTGLAVSADGAHVAVISADGQVRLYQGFSLVASVDVPQPVGVAFPDSSSLLVGSKDKQLRFLRPNPPRTIGKHAGPVRGVAVTPDGKLTISVGDDAQLRVWDTVSGSAVRAVALGGPATSLALSGDGARAAVGSEKTCRLVSIADGKILEAPTATNSVTSVAVNAKGDRYAFASSDNLVRVVAQGVGEWRTLTLAGLKSVALSLDGAEVFAGAADKTIRAERLTKTHQVSNPAAIVGFGLTRDGSKLVVARNNAVLVQKPDDLSTLATLSVATPSALALASDNALAAVGSADKSIRLVQLANAQIVHQYPAQAGAITALAFSPDNKSLGSVDATGVASLWATPVDKQTPAVIVQKPGFAQACAFLTDNKTLATPANDKRIVLLTAPPPPYVNLAGHGAAVYGVASSPDGKQAASAGADNKVIVWDLAAKKALKTLEGHKDKVYAVAFSPDGKSIASASGDRSVILWDLAAGKQIRALTGPLDALYQVAFTPDGKLVVAAGVDKVIRVWEVATGKEVKAFPPMPDEIYGLDLSPDGKRLAVSGYTGSVVIWDREGARQLFPQKLSFGAFDVAYHPAGTHVVVADNDKKAYVIEIPAAAR